MSNVDNLRLPSHKAIILWTYNVHGVKGHFISLDGDIDVKTAGSIRGIMEHQLSLRGDKHSFNFRALGHRWRFERVK